MRITRKGKTVEINEVAYRVMESRQATPRQVEVTIHRESKPYGIATATGGFKYPEQFDYERAERAAIEVAAMNMGR